MASLVQTDIGANAKEKKKSLQDRAVVLLSQEAPRTPVIRLSGAAIFLWGGSFAGTWSPRPVPHARLFATGAALEPASGAFGARS